MMEPSAADRTDKRAFKYDVAFSFINQDEQLATQINDLIQDRISTFLYSERQCEIAGTDGETKLNQVFGSDARIVVVLYRNGWGETRWTRIEQTAIRNRAMEKGYDFTVFIPLDKPPAVPKWLPKNRIWVGLDRWGVSGAASVIEARVQEAGGSPRSETVEDLAARLKREIAFSKERTRFLHSEDGVRAAQEERRKLTSEIARICQDIGDPSADMVLRVETDEEDCNVCSGNHVLHLHWSQPSDHSLERSRLTAVVCEDTPKSRRINVPYDDLPRIKELSFDFDREASMATGWRDVDGDNRFYSTADLAQHCLRLLLDCIGDRRLGEKQDER